jgi:hypothetical protein
LKRTLTRDKLAFLFDFYLFTIGSGSSSLGVVDLLLVSPALLAHVFSHSLRRRR